MFLLKAGRISTAEATTAMAPPKLPPLLLSPRPPRPAGSPGTKGGVCCLSRREPSTDIPKPAGTAEKGAAWTHTRGFPPSSRSAAAAPAAASPAALRPRRSARSEQLQVCLALEQLLIAADEAPKQKESRPRASSPRVGTSHKTSATPRGSNARGAPDALPPTRNPSGFRSSGVTVPTAWGAGPTTGQTLGEGEIGESGTH